MDTASYLERLRTESAAFATAAAKDPDAQVAACPGWKVRDLVRHLGEVHGFWLGTLRNALDGRPVEGPEVDLPSAEELDAAWFEAGADDLHRTLEQADPETPMWNWTGYDLTAAWLYRRMAQETAMHRADAELATAPGAAPEIRTDLAADGIAEIVDSYLPGNLKWLTADGVRGLDIGGTLLVRPTDDAASWLIDIRGNDHPHGRLATAGEGADCVVDGTASDLLLLLWNRIDRTNERLVVNGDGRVLDRWRELPVFS